MNITILSTVFASLFATLLNFSAPSTAHAASFSCSTPTQEYTQLRYADCQALLAIAAVHPDNQAILAGRGWFSDNPENQNPCAWWGVGCESSAQPLELVITSLTLANLGLKGPVIQSVGGLTQLKRLDISGNYLEGPIPESIGNLKQLESLNIDNNRFSGPIPEALGELRNLRGILSLRGRGAYRFSGAIPASLGHLTRLEQLWLHDNDLVGGLPASLGDLTALRELLLVGNRLAGPIPKSLGNLVNLETLDLRGRYSNDSGQGNQFEGSIPEELGNLSNLRILWLNGNRFTSLPVGLGKLQRLVELNAQDNQLGGTLPPDFSGLINLEVLSLENNQLTGSLAPLTTIQRLRVLRLSNNRFTNLDASITGMTGLEFLMLADNPQLNGVIPKEVMTMSALKVFTYRGTPLIEPNETEDIMKKYREWKAEGCSTMAEIKRCVRTIIDNRF